MIQKLVHLSITAMLVGLSGCSTLPPPSDIRVIAVPNAPKAVGPYSQGIVANGFLFTAGSTPRDPATNQNIDGDITAQAARTFDNLEAILAGAGCTWKDVVKVTVYMTNLGDFSKMNEVMAARMGDTRPARSTVGVATLPTGVALEIDLVAKLPK
ncbi:MAG: Rid family detoxifying hydrolase [Pseudomonadota bacterium]|nr:Rid family detoxifying hydrolase [Pseudomonadota bacterium]